MTIRILKSKEFATCKDRFFIDFNKKVVDSSGVIFYKIDCIHCNDTMKETSIFGGGSNDNSFNTGRG